MRKLRLAVYLAKFTQCLALALLCVRPASAGIIIDDFNTTRPFPTCCGEYGTYWAFDSNVFQFGTNGSVIIGGSATDCGGFYREQIGQVLWNFTAQTNLAVTVRVSPDNQATNFILLFRDVNLKNLLFFFPFSSMNTTSFTTLVKPLTSPDWTDATVADPFDFSHVISWDIYGEFSDEEQPIRFEIDSIQTEGPNVTGSLQMRYEITNGLLILSWSTNLTNGFLLQSAPTVLGGWENETNIVIVSNEFRFAVLMTNETRFYRLLATSDPLGQYPIMNEEEFWEPLPSPDSLMMRNEANLAMTDERSVTGISQLPPMPPLPPMPDDLGVGLAGNRAMVSEMQISAMNSGVPPPPSGSVIPTNSYIDVAAYSVIITNLSFNLHWTTNPSDVEKTYSLSYSSHAGGAEYYQEMCYTSHVAVLTNSFPWVRTGGYLNQNCTTVWDPASAIWTNGAQVYTQGSASSTNIMPPPAVLLGKLSGLYNCETYGDINPGSEYGFLDSMYRRQDVQLELHVGRAFSNNWRTFALLSNTAARIDSIAMPESEDWYDCLLEAELLQSAPISFSNIAVLGETLNADGQRFVQLQPGIVTNVTPRIVGATNYQFNLQIVPHKVVTLTRSYHPLFDVPPFSPYPNVPTPTLSNLQARFNTGSLLLATDNDAKIPDNDVALSTNMNSLYRTDDVPLYVEFRLANAPYITNTLARRRSPIFPAQFNHRRYYVITDEARAKEVGSWTGSNIKQVKSMFWGENTRKGYSSRGTKPALIVLAYEVGADTCIHEWGHSCGLYHRNQFSTNNANFNPAPIFGGFMCTNYSESLPRNAINRDERGLMEKY